MYNHYFNLNAVHNPYTVTANANPGSVTPSNAIRSHKPIVIKKGCWPCLSDDSKVVQVEDHRERSVELGFPAGTEQTATLFWYSGDTWESDPSVMDAVGPLPAGSSLTRPEKSDEENRQDQIRLVKYELELIDQKSIRPLRASIDGTATDADVQRLKELEEKTRSLRKRLADLLSSAT